MTAIVYHQGKLYGDRKIFRSMPLGFTDYYLGSKLMSDGKRWAIGFTGILPSDPDVQSFCFDLADLVDFRDNSINPRKLNKKTTEKFDKTNEILTRIQKKGSLDLTYLAVNSKSVLYINVQKDEFITYSTNETVGLGSHGHQIATLLRLGLSPKEVFSEISNITIQISDTFNFIDVKGLKASHE